MDENSSGALDYLKAIFLREVWVSESNIELPPGETEEIVLLALENENKPDGISDKNWKKVKNLHAAMESIPRGVYTPLTLDFVKTLHSIVGDGLIDSAGSFRLSPAKAAQTDVIYAQPSSIVPRLGLLFDFINTKISEASREQDMKEQDIAARFSPTSLRFTPLPMGMEELLAF